ncbi:DegT/DnrJ/EryC1/StrS aminotransferase family protein [Coprococcus phoceensis]|jgi:dTDP-4-amino-4,6-dideoxygalactose transaminase|uniref:DegT/DnrJ/EryC1/StrS aminotransferase family protein n=1 Tax=Coprococcus phoceensis TaxID=1870993 RepID=UPI0008D8E8AF|nr:DegT/DnrJ/EryC1/StrS family aminotransferase [Coprococcus phoceensis]
MKEKLAINGGIKSVTIEHPHEIWPPLAGEDELKELAEQRNLDISIRGKSGPIKELEDDFKKFMDNKIKYTVTFNSGTSALLAAYFSVGIDENSVVIGPATTYHAALSPTYLLKGNVKLVDIDKETRCIDVNQIEKAITSKTKAITVVHQWGYPCDMEAIMRLARKYSLKVIEDCSHAHGSRRDGQLCGTFGDVAVFSLQTNKAVFAGEGGILVTNNEEIYNRATLLGHYRERSRDEINDLSYQKYWVTGFGLKLRMSPFNAIVAKHSLKKFEAIKRERHMCLEYFNERLKEVSYIEPLKFEKNIDMGAWYGFKPLVIQEKLGKYTKSDLIGMLQAEGVEVSNPSSPCLATLPLYSETKGMMFPNIIKERNDINDYPVARYVQNNALSLPTFSNFSRDKEIIDQYIIAMKKVGEWLCV